MKTFLSLNLFWMIVIYIITIGLGFYTSVIIGVIVSIFTIAALIVLNISSNKYKEAIKNEKDLGNN